MDTVINNHVKTTTYDKTTERLVAFAERASYDTLTPEVVHAVKLRVIDTFGSALGVFAYVTGSAVYSRYLFFPYIPGSGELLIFTAALAGAGLDRPPLA